MRILMTTDTVGGVFTYALDLCRVLDRFGVEVVLAAMGPRIDDEQRAAAHALPNVQLRFRRGALEWMDDPWRDVDAAGRWLLALAWQHEVALVHANGYCEAALPFGVPVLAVGHSCVRSWHRQVRGVDAPPRYAEYCARVRRGLRAAQVVVAPTLWMLDTLDELYGPLPLQRCIPNGRSMLELCPRAKLPMVLCAGRLWDEAKNVQALVHAAPSLSWPVSVAGDLTAPGGSPVPRPDWSRNVEVLGHLSSRALAEVMGRASIYALPARYEPFGLTVVEAAASGCALVLGDIPTLRELWTDVAVFVPPGDEAALVRAIEGLVAGPERMRSLAVRARLRAASFSDRSMGRAYMTLYSELVHRRAPATVPITDGAERVATASVTLPSHPEG
jgi:glycogen(starch) synthase